ncbi:ABC transporter permease [Pullulanibacillus sp. KACC 23026]|uniref:ABC transporter permease n=1 Tax=Pullulanibacillus sp. KACC 23026 TaxID=3028315 RepID=UPI0023AF3463|nr:ABC transporter permease [Pullulanibacillus sp. KACC 23026]WEG10904.1 ABC transporter permease [Pullulanibacillus sp. KACC 23026]
MKSIVIKELKLMLKEKGNFFFLILMPILFIVLFGSIFSSLGNSTISLQVVDQDHSAASKAFIEQIHHIKGFKVNQSGTQTANQQIQQIKDGKLSSLIVVPKGFEDNLKSAQTPAKIKFYEDAASSQEVTPIQAVLTNLSDGYREQKMSTALLASGKSQTEIKQIMASPIKIQDIKESASHVDLVSQVVPGYTVMFVFFILITMVRRFFKEKESGMVARLRSTSMSSTTYLIGMWIPSLISVVIQCAVLLLFGHFVYGVNLGNIGSVIAVVVCLAICGTGVGLALALLVRGENQGQGITQIITLGGAALSGLWVPYDLLPPFAQAIGRFTPQYWAMQGLVNSMVHSAQISDVWKSLVILLAFGIAGLCVATLRFKAFLHASTN